LRPNWGGGTKGSEKSELKNRANFDDPVNAGARPGGAATRAWIMVRPI